MYRLYSKSYISLICAFLVISCTSQSTVKPTQLNNGKHKHSENEVLAQDRDFSEVSFLLSDEFKSIGLDPKFSYKTIELLFTGDIMAHKPNFLMKNYNTIYDDVRFIIQSSDLAFANFETPVADGLPLSTYPSFNVHTSYLQAAIDAGFTIFSLANNHSWDQGDEGIRQTLKAFSNQQGIFYAGLKNSKSEPLKPVMIKKNDWVIGFLAITEILNHHPSQVGLVHYVAPTIEARTQFLAKIKNFRDAYPCDILVLSLHTNEPEYVIEVSGKKKEWFMSLAEAGVDIVWAQHPHVLQSWELVEVNREDQKQRVLFMYSLGNLISGQRYFPDIENPSAIREYTGDGIFMKVRLKKNGESSRFTSIDLEPIPVTNYTDPKLGAPVLRSFSQKFIDDLPFSLKKYYTERLRLLFSHFPFLPSDETRSILKGNETY